MKPVVIFGTRGLAETAYFYLKLVGDHAIAGFTADQAYVDRDNFKGLPVVPWERLETRFPPQDYVLFIPIGYKKLNSIRRARYEDGKARGYQFISFIHPKACYYNTPVGENCFILENTVIQPFTTIGDNVILWSGSHIGHHTVIRSHVFFGPYVVVSGQCDIGEQCFVGVGATVRDNITIGRECVISAGAIVSEKLRDRTVLAAAKSVVSLVPSSRLRNL
jgi:sugar O-acyltransferase (sialic acid O-acetyltransferase NeuD family)